jgi:molecular chaperone GrpE
MTDDQTPAEEINEVADAAADELIALRAENQALKDQVLRIAADAENAKRRAEREANDARAYAIQKFARDLLTVADTLGRALAVPPQGEEAKNFVVGVEMTEKALLTAFEGNGLKKIDPAKGARFDPHQHQAMMEQPSTEVGAGGVIQTLQPGYELLGRLVRPAMVVVAAKGSTGESPGGADPAAAAAKSPYAANEPGGPEDAGASVDRKA